MKKFLALALVFALLLCAFLTVHAEDDKPFIGILAPANTHGWVGGVAYFAQQAIESYDVEYRFLTSSNAVEMSSQIEDLISLGSDAIVVWPQFTGVETAAEKALEKLETKIEDIYTNTGNYIANLINTDETGLAVGSVGGEWAALGLARAGKDVPRKDEYLAKVEAFIAENINDNEQLARNESTENSRLILALTAVGVDAASAYGHDLTAGLSDLTFVKKQGLNGPIWALIALDSHDYEVAEGATATRDALIGEILSKQLDDGGWALSSTATAADGDMTSMAVQALAPYYSTNAEVKAAVDEALACLSAMQNAVGGFGSVQGGSATSESCAQVVVALTALGIDPATDERFVKNGISVLDALCSYYVEGGGFEHVEGGGVDGMATEQGYYALASYFRFKDGQTSLYDMSDVIIGEDEPAEEELCDR